jgi:formate dehydrogenase maturation protein FdhE
MDCRDPDKRSSHAAQDHIRAWPCPACASTPTRPGVIVILDTRKGKAVRLFRCQCGELIWDD